jgi:hypothetical protein
VPVLLGWEDLYPPLVVALPKTHPKHIFTAAAMNVMRLFSWHMGDTPAITRLSSFASIAA